MPSNRATIRRREMNKILKQLEHRWLPIDEDTRNNQPKRGINAEEQYEEEVRLGGSARRGCYSIVLAALGSNNILKLKYIVELNKKFFLSQIFKLDKTLVHRPRPTPSTEAPGGGLG